MPHASAFDPETVAVMGRALDAAWAEVESRSAVRSAPEKAGIVVFLVELIVEG